MAFCANCGSDVQGKFCAKCGAPAGVAQAPAPGAYTPAPGPQAAGLEENVACALCYLLGVLTGILFLVLEPYNKSKTVRFHAFQSIFCWVAVMAAWVVLLMLGFILPFGWGFLITLYDFAVIGLFLVLMYKAYNRERFVLPIIGPLAEKQA